MSGCANKAKEGERADAADAARLQLADKLQLLSADKAKTEVELVDHKRKVENMSIALDEASVMRGDVLSVSSNADCAS